MIRSEECHHSVLIVDPSAESREVLRTALERRGIRILEARQAAAGQQLARDHHPEVIVLDSESVSNGDPALPAWWSVDSPRNPTFVILGKIDSNERLPVPNCVLPKPYHYGPLVRTIEQFVERGIQDGVAVCDSRARSGEAVRTS